jgi:hypothetical protein
MHLGDHGRVVAATQVNRAAQVQHGGQRSGVRHGCADQQGRKRLSDHAVQKTGWQLQPQARSRCLCTQQHLARCSHQCHIFQQQILVERGAHQQIQAVDIAQCREVARRPGTSLARQGGWHVLCPAGHVSQEHVQPHQAAVDISLSCADGALHLLGTGFVGQFLAAVQQRPRQQASGHGKQHSHGAHYAHGLLDPCVCRREDICM